MTNYLSTASFLHWFRNMQVTRLCHNRAIEIQLRFFTKDTIIKYRSAFVIPTSINISFSIPFITYRKSHKISLSKSYSFPLLSCCIPIILILFVTPTQFFCGLFLGYFPTTHTVHALILLAFWRYIQRVPWQMKSILIISLKLLVFAVFPWFIGFFCISLYLLVSGIL